MYTPTADVIARSFGLEHPFGELEHVRSGDTDTWRLVTSEDRYLVKGYRATTDGQFTAGGLIDQLGVAMEFERDALAAGLDMAEPISPVRPVKGWLSRINGRYFRVYRWIEHRQVRADDDIDTWLARTMVRIHRLRPPRPPGLPDWWRGPLLPRTTWEDLFDEAGQLGRSWSTLAHERLPAILEISGRIARLCRTAPDCVTTHGDFKRHNMLMAPRGPILVDWDSVRVDSAALEAGRVAHIFGAGESEPVARILEAYVAAGGDIAWAGRDLFLSVLRHDLEGLLARIRVSLGRAPVSWWMGDPERIDHDITDALRDLPDRVERLDALALELSGIAARHAGP